MADEHVKQRDHSFNWPPTTEELEAIQVFDMSGDGPPRELTGASTRGLTPERSTRALTREPKTQPILVPVPETRPILVTPPVAAPARAKPFAWHRFVTDSVVTQAGLVAASLAAIGIAITSMLAPAQPAGHALKTATRLAAATPPPGSASPATPPGPTAAPEQPTFRPMVTLDLEAPSASARAQPQPGQEPGLRAQRPQAVATASQAPIDERAPVAVHEISQRSTSPQTRATRRADARHDPVSRFAVRTGLSIWKAMRAVGRSFRRAEDGNWPNRPTARSGVARRTATAVDLEADNAPSDQ